MPKFNEIEKIVEDYERKIEKLKYLEEQLKKLDAKGFEKETSEIKKHLKDPKSLEKVEGDIRKLKNKIEESKKKVEESKEEPVKEPQRRGTPRHFPYELTPDYENAGLIGKGGFARVFRANRKKDNAEVAVKIPISIEKSIGKSFLREMENWTKLKHQNIVELFDYNVLPLPYFEMELCDTCLETILKPMEIEKAAWMIFNIAEGLKFAHNKHIIHRDIKPQNVLLKKGIPKISDWGLSKLIAESKTSTMTSAALSLKYAAPEQISKKFGAKDEQTDIWQLGTIFYELVTGRPPFEGDDLGEIGFSIVTEPIVLPSEINEKFARVDNIVAKCLQKEKTKRYKNMVELQRDLVKVFEYEIEITEVKKDPTRTAYLSGELLLINMKIEEKRDAYKYAMDMLKYAKDSIKNELSGLVKELEEIIENNLDINEQLIEKADIIVHKIRMDE